MHPTLPVFLTSSDDMLIKLWDWDKGFACMQVRPRPSALPSPRSSSAAPDTVAKPCSPSLPPLAGLTWHPPAQPAPTGPPPSSLPAQARAAPAWRWWCAGVRGAQPLRDASGVQSQGHQHVRVSLPGSVDQGRSRRARRRAVGGGGAGAGAGGSGHKAARRRLPALPSFPLTPALVLVLPSHRCGPSASPCPTSPSRDTTRASTASTTSRVRSRGSFRARPAPATRSKQGGGGRGGRGGGAPPSPASRRRAAPRTSCRRAWIVRAAARRRRPPLPGERRRRQAGQGVGLPDQGVRADPGRPRPQHLQRRLPPGAAHHLDGQRGRHRARVARDHLQVGGAGGGRAWRGVAPGARARARRAPPGGAGKG